MFNIIKNSLKITWKNQIISLFLVLYLIVVSVIIQKISFVSPLFVALISAGILIFTAAFFSGWHKMIKIAIVDFYKADLSEEERIKNAFELRKKFLDGVANYILPVLLGILIYYILFLILIRLDVFLADKFIGSIDFLAEDTKSLTISNEALIEYIKNLPNEKLIIIFGWQALVLISISLFGMFTIFWPSALYFNEQCSKNPFRAYWASICAIFKKPLSVIGLNLIIGILFFIFTQFAPLSMMNVVFSFFYMVFGIYFFVFVTVLIFNYYGKTFENLGNSGCDSVGQIENCD